MTKPKSPPARADITKFETTTTRFNAVDVYYLEALKRETGITNRSDLLRNCIVGKAKELGIPPPPPVLETQRKKS